MVPPRCGLRSSSQPNSSMNCLTSGGYRSGCGSSHLSLSERFCFQNSHTLRAFSVSRFSVPNPFIVAKCRAPGPTRST